MIVIDTSALVAILGDEPGARRYTELIAEDAEPCISSATFAEAGIVLSARYGAAGLHYGRCFSYALARRRDAPLLFKGSGFSQTDITAAIRCAICKRAPLQ